MEKSEAGRKTLTKQIKIKALELGFNQVGICKAENLRAYKEKYKKWLSKGYQGTMKYLENHEPAKTDPSKILPNAKSIILVTLNYYRERTESEREGKIARYAYGRDYHKVFKGKLKKLEKYIKELAPNCNTRFFADAGPLLERQYAEKAGIGFVGKNGMVITLPNGSWVLIGEIITNIELQHDKPADESHGTCGTCTRCIDICPTGALQENGAIKANKCISYLTIENKGPIPKELRPKIGNWIFGCDLCQEVCPHNFRQKETHEPDFKNAIAGNHIDIKEILEIQTDQEFTERFAGSPLMRAKRKGLQRNACVVAGNTKREDLIPILKKLSQSKDQLIAEHAKWAIEQITATT